MKNLSYLLEACGIYLLYGLFRILPLDAASALGGLLGRRLGPLLAAERKARRNLELALPGKTDQEYKTILRAMWDNLGRVMAEYPHLKRIVHERVAYEGFDTVRGLAVESRPMLFISGHLANWEINGAALALHDPDKAAFVFRTPNNPYVERLLESARSLDPRVKTFTKSTSGMRGLMTHLKNGGHAGLLIDQKYNPGIAVPFFGHPAMTSTAFADLALRFEALVIPVRIERLQGAHFRITFYPQMLLRDDQGAPCSPEDLVRAAHAHLEHWIRTQPGQWLWLHRRWDSKRLAQYESETGKETANEHTAL